MIYIYILITTGYWFNNAVFIFLRRMFSDFTMQLCFNTEGLILSFAKLFSGKYLIGDQMNVTFFQLSPMSRISEFFLT